MARSFGGVFNIHDDSMRVFKSVQKSRHGEDEFIDGLNNPVAAERFGEAYAKAKEEIELISEASVPFDHAAFLEGKQTPVFFGSAINNFGVQEVLDALVELAPPPGPRHALQRTVQPDEPKFTDVMFKV